MINKFGSMTVSEQLSTYPSLNQPLTLSCYQLTVIGLGRGRWAVAQNHHQSARGALGEEILLRDILRGVIWKESFRAQK